MAKRSCAAFTEMERDLSENDGQGEGPVAVGVSYHMGWRKRGKSYDSSSGVGTGVGLKTGKVISYATRNTLYRVCQEAVASNREPTVHDCRRNHEGSSKRPTLQCSYLVMQSKVAYVTRRMLVMMIAQQRIGCSHW